MGDDPLVDIHSLTMDNGYRSWGIRGVRGVRQVGSKHTMRSRYSTLYLKVQELLFLLVRVEQKFKSLLAVSQSSYIKLLFLLVRVDQKSESLSLFGISPSSYIKLLLLLAKFESLL